MRITVNVCRDAGRKRQAAPIIMSLGLIATLEAQRRSDPVTQVFEVQHIDASQLSLRLELFSAQLMYNDELNEYRKVQVHVSVVR
jgi:hypothetical protein